MKFLIVMGGKMLIRIMNVGEDDHSGWTAKLSYVVGIPSGILVVTLGLFWLTPFIIRTFYSLFSWLTYQIGLGASPLFDWFNRQEMNVDVTPSGKKKKMFHKRIKMFWNKSGIKRKQSVPKQLCISSLVYP